MHGRPEASKVLLDPEYLGKLVAHPQAEIRLRALALIISTPATTQAFSAKALRSLTEPLCYVHGDHDPQVRNEIFSILRKMVGRIRGGSARSLKAPIGALNKTEHLVQDAPTLKMSKDFMEWYISFLLLELRPGASYQRRIFALQMMRFLLQSGLGKDVARQHLSKFGEDELQWPFYIYFFGRSFVETLLRLLLDPYEDIRTMAHSLLKFYNGSLHIPSKAEVRVVEHIARRSRRGDHADGLGRLYDLWVMRQHSKRPNSPSGGKGHLVHQQLEKLQSAISNIDQVENVGEAALPLHGLLLSLKYMVIELSSDSSEANLEPSLSWQEFSCRLLSICRLVWKKVQDSLCRDSPEGQYDEDDVIGGPKDVLAYAWRALRDSSLVLQSLLSTPFFANHSSHHCAGFEDFRDIGSLCFDQLSMLRHRGAFSTVCQTFALCCQRCGTASEQDVYDLPRTWYQQAVVVMKEQSSKLTRRSAGLPSLITGVLSARDDSLFELVVLELSDIATMPAAASSANAASTDLPQVHALNCLKDIFTNRKFAEATEPWLLGTLRLASSCLSCPM